MLLRGVTALGGGVAISARAVARRSMSTAVDAARVRPLARAWVTAPGAEDRVASSSPAAGGAGGAGGPAGEGGAHKGAGGADACIGSGAAAGGAGADEAAAAKAAAAAAAVEAAVAATKLTYDARLASATEGDGAPPFRVLQWNVLADGLAYKDDNFIRVADEAILGWPTRRDAILEAALAADADIVCLEELNHVDEIKAVLADAGYECVYAPKWSSPAEPTDGTGVFVRSSRFSVDLNLNLDYRDADADGGARHSQRGVVVMLSDKVAKGRRVCVGATHLKAKRGSANERRRVTQISTLLRAVERVAGVFPAVICGDFNADPGSAPYEAVASHELGFRSAYGPDGAESEPEFTTWKFRPSGECKHTIDYIWYRASHLEARRLLALPSEADIGDNALPCEVYPSDHLALGVELDYANA